MPLDMPIHDRLEKAIKRREQLVAAYPGVPKYESGLARSYGSLGNVHNATAEVVAAREAYGKAIAGFEALVAAHPGVPD
jgi:TPP-dependent indolepyruvate ferredoxin oxidoreductase alpha subunit